MLKNIIGIKIPKFPFDLIKIGDLIYFDGSLMSVFKDENNNPFVFDWVDSDSNFNRWLVYQLERQVLSDYVFNLISHYKLIQSAVNNLYFLIDKNQDNDIINCQIVTHNNIPSDYLPKDNLFFEEEDSVNLSKIIKNFSLKKRTEREFYNLTFNLLEEAKKNDTELFNLHISSNNSKVKYGKIRTSLLGEILVNYQKLSIATAISIFDGKDRVPKEKRTRRKKGQLELIKELGETEYLYSKAASFSVFLKPIRQTVDIYEKVSSEVIATSIFNLFEASNSLTALKEFKEQIDSRVLVSYNNFLKGIKEEDVMVTVQYANPKNSVSYINKFDKLKATQVIHNLEVIEVGEVESVRIEGRFIALDRTNFSFKFFTVEGIEYDGKFSFQLKEGMYLFNLTDLYLVTIEIEEINISGKIENKENITMVSCVSVEKND